MILLFFLHFLQPNRLLTTRGTNQKNPENRSHVYKNIKQALLTFYTDEKKMFRCELEIKCKMLAYISPITGQGRFLKYKTNISY